MSIGFEKKHSKCLNSILRKEGIVAVKILPRFWLEGNDVMGFGWKIIMPQIPLTAYWIIAFQKKSTIFQLIDHLRLKRYWVATITESWVNPTRCDTMNCFET
jgi:hypothetical protein